MPAATVLFRADAGPNIGLGHLQRSFSLADALNQLNVEVRFLASTNSEGLRRADTRGFEMDLLGDTEPWSNEDIKKTCDVAASTECNAIVVDSHETTSEYLSSLRSAGFFVIARDDLALGPFPCQMVFNGNFDAESLPYQSSSGDTQFLLGPKYMVLGRQYEEVTLRQTSNSVKNVLFIIGGADHHNLMPRLLGLLDELPGDFRATAVVGGFFKDVASVESVAKSVDKPVRLVHSPDSVYELMLEADLAVSAAGQTLYELACIGCPTVAFSVAANQLGHLTILEDARVLKSAGDAERDDVVSAVGQALSALLADEGGRAAMSAAGQRVVDGKGAHRVAQRILAEITV